MKRLWHISRWALLAGLLAACASASGDPLPEPEPTREPTPPAPATLVDKVIADLAARLGVPASEIERVSEEAVVWPDGSLGCPKPGEAYIQILIEGYRIVLMHERATYEYHTSSSHFVLCEQPESKPQPSPLPTPNAGAGPTPAAVIPRGVQPLVDLAIADLAQRLSMDPALIVVVSFSSEVWPDGSLGCPQPGMAYTQVQVEGYRIRLKAGDQMYDYHGGGERGPFLCKQK